MPDKLRFILKPDFCIGFAIMLMLFPTSFCFSWVLAAMFHELCHYMMLRICGIKVYSVQVGIRGAVIHTQPMTVGREVLCALAGPVGGFLLLLFSNWIPRIAVCAFLQSAYNLLPIYPLDGGRAVHGILCKLFPANIANTVLFIVECIILLTLGVFSFWSALYLFIGPLPILIYTMVLWKRIKIPCKRSILQVQ